MNRILGAQESRMSQERLLGLLKVLFVSVGRHYLHSLSLDESPELRLFIQFNALVINQQHRKRSVSEYALALSVGTGLLNNALQKVSGMTASQIIDYHIICEAKRAVITTDYPMKKIAADLRFDDLAHFSKFFRVRSGMTYSNFERAYAL
jgi:AraC-like DNA-binding protein